MHDQTITRCAACLWLALALLCCAAGCFIRTVYVPDGKAVRLREDVKAKVWVLDGNGMPVAGEMVLPEGWWIFPDPGK